MNALRALALLLLLGACAAPRLQANEAVTHRLGERDYLLLDAHRGTAPVPLVVVLHGGGGNAGIMAERWAATARAEGFILAAPNGIGRLPRRGTWNAGGCCGEAQARGVDDVGFIAAVIADAARQAPVDRRRVFVAGLSNGGMLTHRVAIALGERIAGAAVVAGAMFGDEPAPRAPVPMLIIHGEQDRSVAYGGGISPNPLVARAQTRPFLPVRQAVTFWRQADGCAGAPAATSRDGVTVEGAAGCPVRFVSLAREGHGWPEGASAMVWDFFRGLPGR